MKPFTITLLVGLGFASGMLVPLIGLHATEDFARLEPFKSILLGGERIAADRGTATAASADANAPNRQTNKLDYRNSFDATAELTPRAAVAATPETVSPSRIDIADTKAADFERSEALPIASKASPELLPKLSGTNNPAPTENDSAKTAVKASTAATNPWIRQLPVNSPTPLTQ